MKSVAIALSKINGYGSLLPKEEILSNHTSKTFKIILTGVTISYWEHRINYNSQGTKFVVVNNRIITITPHLVSFIQRALHSFVFTISFSVIGNSHRKIHLGNFYLENRQRKINFLTQSKLVCQLEGSGEVKSPDSYTRFLLRLKCTLRCWSHGYFPSGQSCSCISLWKGPPLQRRSQEPVFWSFCSKAGPA